jgi:hypothetical protein
LESEDGFLGLVVVGGLKELLMGASQDIEGLKAGVFDELRDLGVRKDLYDSKDIAEVSRGDLTDHHGPLRRDLGVLGLTHRDKVELEVAYESLVSGEHP